MLLTIYYIAATFFRSWRIKSVCNKIATKLSEKCSVVFYNVSKEGIESNITSELCINHTQARISDILWLRDNQRGCSLVPQQIVHLGPWVTFPESPNLIPFEFSCDLNDKFDELDLDQSTCVNLLLETDIVPLPETENDDIIMIEEYGKPLAWKVDSHFAVILESDLKHFTKLIMSTFMQDNFSINDRLPLIRIESVSYEGRPQPFDLLKNHLRKQLISRAMRHLSSIEWEKHLNGLRSLSILANQATEFEYNKNRTEGKTGIVKPDLIPSSKNVEDEVTNTTTTSDATDSIKLSSSPKKSPVKIDAAIIQNTSPNKQQPMTTEDKKPKQIETATKSKEQKTSPKKVINDSIAETVATTEIKTSSSSPQMKSPNKSTPTDNLDSITTTTCKSNESDFASFDVVDKIGVDDHGDEDAPIVPRPIPKASEVIRKNNTKRPSLVRNKGSLSACKPPNVLVYSDSTSLRDNVIETLKDILERDMYTIYPLSSQQVEQKVWIDNTSLLIVCGTVDPQNAEVLVDYFLQGGKMLSICSDLLHIIVPTYRTAEVREHELVQFSYDKWQKVKMMHHIFCYQPSPVKKHFSTESDESNSTLTKKPALVCPRSVEVKDLQGDLHNLDVKVLGSEETWNTPSLLLANNVKSGGKAVFSQVHLEADPTQYESDEIKFSVLKQSDKARLEIFADLLKTHLDIFIQKPEDRSKSKDIFKNAYFLGHHEAKFELLNQLKSKMENDNLLKLNNLTIKFCGKGEQPSASATKEFLPILTLSCPEDFSTVKYFDNLKTKSIGRLVIYAPIITTSMHIINELKLTHGIAIIARQQTNGMGRGTNQWLGSEGCIMFSIQLHIPIDSVLGQRLSLIQHLIAVSMVHAVINNQGYENLDIGVKWPNDIYANGITKIGGLIVNSQLLQTNAICNIGCGLNLNNSNPTLCINDLIRDYNRNSNKNLSLMEYEITIAKIFTEIEKLLERVQNDDLAHLYELYYRYWLHRDQEIMILDKSGHRRPAKVVGIDEYGYLEVQIPNGKVESVQPDGNSFDMLRGLILPK